MKIASYRLALILLGLTLFLPVGSSLAQDGTELHYGDSFTAMLAGGSTDTYWFTCNAGDFAVIEINASFTLDVRFEAPRYRGSSSGSDHVTIDRDILEDGECRLYISGGGGSYNLSLQNMTLDSSRTLRVGETLTAQQAGEELVYWWFEANAGDLLDLQLRSVDASFDYVDVLAPDGSRLPGQILSYSFWRMAGVFPQTGTYIVRAVGGELYTASLNRLASSGSLAPGGVYQGSLADGYGVGVVTFDGHAGDSLVLTLESANPDGLEPQLSVFGPGTTLARDEYTAFETTHRQRLLLVEDGTHTAIVTSNRPSLDTGGGFTLALEQQQREPQRIAYGETASVLLDRPPRPVFQFEGQAGDVVRFSVRSDSFIADGALGGPGLYVYDDYFSGVMASVLVPALRLPADGVYTANAGPYYEDINGEDSFYGASYPLVIEQVDLATDDTIAYDTPLTAELRNRSVDVYYFEANAGDQVGAWLSSVDFAPEVYLYGPQGMVSRGVNIADRVAVAPTVRLIESGIYAVIVGSSDGLSGGAYDVSIHNGFLPQATQLSYGDAQDATLEENQLGVYQFEGAIGDFYEWDKSANGLDLLIFTPRYSRNNHLFDHAQVFDPGIHTAVLYAINADSPAVEYTISLTGSAASFADTDNDGVADPFDRCLDAAGDSDGCPDSDGDGVIDPADACPDEAGSVQGCPDTDGDGVGDGIDLCPETPGSLAGQGCPDADGDGVDDADDACPAQAGLPETDGCLLTGEVAAGGAVNLRAGPGTNFDITGSLASGTTFILLGRNEAADWVYIRVEDGDAPLEAWLFTTLMNPSGGFEDILPVVGSGS